MATSFVLQLNEIATRSRNDLDLKAQKAAHSQSLIFERKIAGSQDFDSLYQLCSEGFEDLCKIDHRFREYRRNLFSQQSKTQERDQMTADQNATLDTVIEACLGLLGGRLLLSPAMKVAEWLVRRFRVHEYNTSFLLLTFLPYHATSTFRNILSILPSQLPPQFKLLGPYTTSLTNPPRHAIAYGAVNNDGFFNAISGYVLQVCRAGSQHQLLLSFWASITAEAVAGRIDLTKSGRKEIQRQRQEDLLLKVLPVLSDGLSMSNSSEMVIACFTLVIILASKSQMADNVLDGLMEAVAGALRPVTMDAGLVCLSILTQKKSDQSVIKRVVSRLTDIDDLAARLQTLNKRHGVDTFALAIVQGVLSDMQVDQHSQCFGIVERLLFAELMDALKVAAAIGSLLRVLKNDSQGVPSTLFRDAAADLLRKVNDSDRFSSVIANAVSESGLNLAVIEASLETTIDGPDIGPTDMDEMEVDSDTRGDAQSPLLSVLENVPLSTVEEHSFLSHSPSHLFRSLIEAFTLAVQRTKGVQLFLELPLWTSSTEMNEPLFASFFIRAFSGPYPVQVRYAALSVIGKWLSKLSDFDSQAILPYILVQLADPAQRIRQAASEALLAIDRSFPSTFVEGERFRQWGINGLYGSGKGSQSLSFVATKDVSKVVQRALLPVIEECILDRTQIKTALESALKPTSRTSHQNQMMSKSIELKKYLRQSFFRLMLVHLVSTPLYSVKIGLLGLLANVEKVGGIQKYKELRPLLSSWASLEPGDVERLASTEFRDTKLINSAISSIVSSAENDIVGTFLDLVSSTNSKRPDFVSVASQRIQSLWPQMSTEEQSAAANRLLSSVFDGNTKASDRSSLGRDVLQSIDLSTVVLLDLLNNVNCSIDAVREHLPASKKRRSNESHALPIGKSSTAAGLASIRETTFILELVDNSSPERRPELLGGLFHVLITLHQLEMRDQSDLSYLLSLTLSSLLAVVQNAASQTPKVDMSAVRVDIVIDCLRMTSNSQVQNAALLLVAAIARFVPERVLDNIMPIFTFMGTNVLSKDDEYSNYVVDQTMDNVLPPLVDSLRSRGEDIVAETSNLMFSFSVAYEHMPSHRRLPLFRKLLSNLDDQAFLWVLIYSLTQRYADESNVTSFVVSLVNTFELNVQLETCVRLVILVEDILAGQPGQPGHHGVPVESEDVTDRTTSATIVPLLQVLNKILAQSNIRISMARLDQSQKNAMEGLMSLWKNLLDRTISLVQRPQLDDALSTAANSVLSSLLSLLPIVALIDIAEDFVHDGSSIVKRRVLRLLESRLSSSDALGPVAQRRAVSFLDTLFRLLEEFEDEVYKHAAITCVDRICDNYGRQNIPAVVQAARVISGDSCLRSSDTKTNILALLSLSSIAESVKDAIVPVVPRIVPKIFGLLRLSLEEDSVNSQLHNACFTLFSALLAQVPFIISNEYLDQMLVLSAESSNSELYADSSEVREQALQLIGKNIALVNVAGSLQRTWATTVENDVSAVQQALSVLMNSVKAASKSTVQKNAVYMSDFLLQAFDLRRVQFTNRTEDSYEVTDVSTIENTINSLTMEIIYKLNDTAFRPIFLRFIEWATKCRDVQSSNLAKAQTLRRTTLFSFLTHFFKTLKSIVTSYATHIVEPAVAVLKDLSNAVATPISTASSKSQQKPKRRRSTASPADQDSLNLYVSALSALRAAARHDHDSHFSTPSLFTPLADALVSQLHLAPHLTYAPHISSSVTPAIVALATAVVDTPDHLKALNRLICALRRSDHTPVRLASVKVQLALAGVSEGAAREEGRREEEEEEEGIAEEWCGTILSVGEGMVYVNEMLEDEDEEVEGAVRRLVRRVRECVGEEGIFE